MHNFSGKKQSTTDKKSVTRFFQTEAAPPALWKACDYMLKFNFKTALFAGSVNPATNFVSRLELKVTEKILPKIREDIETTVNGLKTSTSDVADEEQFFFTEADNKNKLEEKNFQQTEQSRQDAKGWVANEEPS